MRKGNHNTLGKSLKVLLEEKAELEKNEKDTDLGYSLKDYVEAELKQKADILFKDGIKQLKQKELIEAMGLFKAVLCLVPQHGKAMNNLALTLYKLGYKRKAFKILNELLKIHPEDDTAKENLNIIGAELKNGKE